MNECTSRDMSELTFKTRMSHLAFDIADQAARQLLSHVDRTEILRLRHVPVERIAKHLGVRVKISAPNSSPWAMHGLEGQAKVSNQLSLNNSIIR